MPENFEVLNMIIHRIEKRVGETGSTLTLRDSILPEDERVTKFLHEVNRAYHKRGARQYGIFNPDNDTYPFQEYLQNYLSAQEEFVDFTHRAMNLYRQRINQKPLATGGYVVFSHYSEDDRELFLIIALNDKVGYAIDEETLSIVEQIQLDFDKIDLANKIDINMWDDQEDHYLSFIKGKKQISDYFLEFVGCTTKISPTEDTNNLINVISEYMGNNNFGFDQKHTIRANVLSYCRDKVQNGEEIELRAIANMINPENPNDFYDFASSDDKRLNDSFYVDKSPLKRLTTVEYKGRDFRISFSAEVINTKITYDQEQNTLTINDIPEDLKRQISERL